MGKKKTKKVVRKSAPRSVKHEITVRVQPIDARPTVDDLAQPMKEGKELAITKTWVSDKQIMRMVQKTPSQFVYSRPAKGGGRWNYVTGAYVEKVLNFVFGFMWDFEIVEHGITGETVWVKGRLTVKDPKGNTITKMQFGRADVKYRKNSKDMLDFGNDLKAASTDALKKCASLLGIASDIYGSTEYKNETGNDPAGSGDKPLLPAPGTEVAADEPKKEHYCYGPKGSGCPNGNETIDDATYNYSMRVFKKALCRECQKDIKPATK